MVQVGHGTGQCNCRNIQGSIVHQESFCQCYYIVTYTIQVACAYVHGMGAVMVDPSKGVDTLRRLETNGSKLGRSLLAQYCFQGRGMEYDEKKAVELWESCIDVDPYAQLQYAWYLEAAQLHTELATDLKAAQLHTELATDLAKRGWHTLMTLADGGCPFAQSFVGEHYRCGWNHIDIDTVKAMHYSHLAALQGSCIGQFNLGILILNAPSVDEARTSLPWCLFVCLSVYCRI